MREATLSDHLDGGAHGLVSVLRVTPEKENGEEGFECLILRPEWWRGIKGDFVLRWKEHPIHGFTWEFEDVPGHTAVLIHPGNLAGESTTGLKATLAADSTGCNLPGATLYHWKKGEQVGEHLLERDQWGVTSSGPTFAALKRALNCQDFKLTIL